MKRRKLAIGVLVDSEFVPNWAYRMIETIIVGNFAEIRVVLRCGAADVSTPEFSWMSRMKRSVVDSFLTIDRLLDTSNLSKASVPRKFRNVLPQTDQILIECFDKDSLAQIYAYQLDIIINLTVRELPDQFAGFARCGFWSIFHNDFGMPVGPDGLWEVLENAGEIGMVLLATLSNRSAIQLFRSYSQTDSVSVVRTNSNNYWKTAAVLPRKIEELYKSGETEFFSNNKSRDFHPVFDLRKKYETISLMRIVQLCMKNIIKRITNKFRRYFWVDQYILLYQFAQFGMGRTIFNTFRKIVPPFGRFWADPFIVFAQNKYFVFLEEVFWKNDKGHIAYLTIDTDGTVSTTQKIIEQPYNMSYPFVFSYLRSYYMIPETAANRTIELYKCTNFPDKWEKVAVLMQDVEAFDVTLIQKDGKWWMFANVRGNTDMSSLDELYLFYSEDLLSGKWEPHPRNPIVSDVKSARPAGKLFLYNGELYRPSQNSWKTYGYGMKINHIVEFSETAYKEECIAHIDPVWDNDLSCVHTFNFSHNIILIDGMIKRSRITSLFKRWR